MVARTHLDCQVCQKHNCKFITDQMENPIYNDKGQLMFAQAINASIDENNITIPIDINNDVDYSGWWVKKYCTETAVDGFIKFFPYILFVVAMVIVAIEKVFTKTFKAGKKLTAFYNLLVKEEKDETDNKNDKEIEKYDGQTVDDRKDVIEMAHSFTSQDNFLLSYLLRTVIELLFAMFLLIWLCVYGVPVMYYEQLISCNVYGKMYECAGHPQLFLMWVLGVTIMILVLYIFCCIYNTLWLALPNIRELGKIMNHYAKQSQTFKTLKKSETIDEDDTENGNVFEEKKDGEEDYEQDNLDTFYFKNPDLRLLLDLLAVSSGVAHSLRILVLFDKVFRSRFEPGALHFSNLYYHENDGKINIAEKDSGMSVEEKKKSVYNVTVTFKEAIALNRIFAKRKDLSCIYTVEILPRTARSSIMKAINIGKRGWRWALREMRRSLKSEGDMNGETDENGGEKKVSKLEEVSEQSLFTNWKVRLYDLEIEREYTIRVCTIINGRKIAQRIEKLKAKDVDHECKILECRRIHMFQES